MVKRQKAAQEPQMRLAPGSDVIEIVARGDRPADNQQQDLRERVSHAPALARLLDDREITQQAGKTRLGKGRVHGCGSESLRQSQTNHIQTQAAKLFAHSR
jgi:hypothetical protein